MREFAERPTSIGLPTLLGRTLLGLVAICAGCTAPAVRPNGAEIADESQDEVVLIGDLTHPDGMTYVQVEAVSLVTGLDGTGGDPPPTSQRAALLDEMQRYKVADPARVLASRDTALVLVRGYLRPGIQKGDHFDVEVRVPTRSNASSLRGGWLLQARLTELAVLNHQIHKGHLLATAEGPVLVDPASDSEESPTLATRGRVLGGGTALKSRPLGLTIVAGHQDVRVSQQIGSAINQRFYLTGGGRKKGVATPKTDKRLQLELHPRYKDNVARYMHVLQNIAYRETPLEHQERLELLERQLLEPLTAQRAAVRLEAIGPEAVSILKRGMDSDNREVKFYAAESLAYLDEPDAAEVLANIARDDPVLRVHALGALSVLDNAISQEALRKLLSESSAETRYGAFRALWAMNSRDPLVEGEELGGRFSYHRLDVAGPPMIHVTRSFRPEIVLFSPNQKFRLPLTVNAGKHILINGRSPTEVTVSRFAPGQPDQVRAVVPTIDAVIRAVVELGGTYPDVVQALQEAKDTGALPGQFKVDALPEGGRRIDRSIDESDESAASDPQHSRGANSLPGLFFRHLIS